MAQVKASRFNRFINYLATTFRYDSVAKELSNIKQLTDETAKNHIDLTCRQIRSSKDFSDALKFAHNAKESVRFMHHFPAYLHALGDALMDQVAEHQGIKMTRSDQVLPENQTQLNDAIISIVRLTRFASGTPEIVRAKIGKRIEENLTAQELIRSYKDAFKAEFLKKAPPELLDKYADLETQSSSNLSFAERDEINFQKRQLFKERNEFLDTYRLQLQMLGLQGTDDDIKIPDVIKESIKVNEENRRKHEYTIWAEVKAHYERSYSDFKQQISIQPTATKPTTNRGDFEETTVLFPNNPPFVTADEQNEIEFEKFDDSDTAENTTAHFKVQVLPELEEVLGIGDTEHDEFLMPENSDMENYFKPTLLQRIKAALKGFFSESENLPVFELADSDDREDSSNTQEQSGSPAVRLMPEFIAQAERKKDESQFESDSEEAVKYEFDRLSDSAKYGLVKRAIDLVNKNPGVYDKMADAIKVILDEIETNKQKAKAGVTAIEEG